MPARPSNRPAVSVLMPIRNGLPYLVQAYASLASQSLDDWELVAVIDSSSDSSEQFLRNLKDPRIVVIALDKPAGLAHALNIGLAACRADLVARLDADDECLPLRLELQREFLGANPRVTLIGTAAEIIDADGRRRAVRRFRSGSSTLSRALLWRNQFIHPSVMFSKTTVLQLGGYNERMVKLEDYELWLRIASISDIDNIPDALIRYRQHGSQTSRAARLASTIPSPTQFRILADSRRRAAARLGVSSSSSRLRDVAWLAGQFRRELRLRLNLQRGYR